MARLTFKKWFEYFKPDEETTTILVNGYTEISEPIFEADKTMIYPNGMNYFLVGEAVDKLADYEDAEEQGLLLRLPCKVGDTAYYLHRVYLKNVDKWIDEIDEVEVDSFILNINLFVNVSYYIGSDRFGKTLTPYKTLFFTKEEAEAALQAMQEGK